MAPRFVGRYEHSLDTKGRLILPARFRLQFEASAFISKHNERCLAIWTPDAFERKADEMARLMDGTTEERARARSWSMGTAELDLDRQGRVAVPQYLRDFAGLAEQSMVLVHGALSHIELWNPETWGAQEAVGDASLSGGSSSPTPVGAGAPVPAGE